MRQDIVAFGLDCIGPSSESEGFLWMLVLGSVWVFVSSLLLYFAINVCNKRKTLHTRRTDLVSMHAVGIGVFYVLGLVGVIFGNGSEGACRSPSSSAVGLLTPIAITGLGVAGFSAIAFMFWFKKYGTGQALSDVPQKYRLPYRLVSFWLVSILAVIFLAFLGILLSGIN